MHKRVWLRAQEVAAEGELSLVFNTFDTLPLNPLPRDKDVNGYGSVLVRTSSVRKRDRLVNTGPRTQTACATAVSGCKPNRFYLSLMCLIIVLIVPFYTCTSSPNKLRGLITNEICRLHSLLRLRLKIRAICNSAQSVRSTMELCHQPRKPSST